MVRYRFFLVLLLIAASAAAQEVSTMVVPVVGSVFGPGPSLWKTDVEVVNDGALPADVALELVTVPDAFILITLGPGERQRFPDIVGQAFGLQIALSPLRITTNRRTVRATASAYAVNGATVSAPQPIEVYHTSTWFPIRVLDGLAFSEAQRTNIGLVNFSDHDAQFILALQRIPGRNLAVTTLNVHASSIAHVGIQSLFPMITEGTGFSVVVETPSRDTHVYASVIESATNTGRFIVPRVGSR